MKNYSKKYNVFFIHIPKNAGTSINEVLEIPIRQRGHRIPSRLYEICPQYKETISFTVVRNPWDRMTSLYEFRKLKRQITDTLNFSRWLKGLLTRSRKNMDNLNQYDCLYNGEKCYVTYILRFENLEQEWKDLSLNCFEGTLPPLPRLNKTKEKNYRDYYDNVTKEAVAKAFAKDINHFKYEY